MSDLVPAKDEPSADDEAVVFGAREIGILPILHERKSQSDVIAKGQSSIGLEPHRLVLPVDTVCFGVRLSGLAIARAEEIEVAPELRALGERAPDLEPDEIEHVEVVRLEERAERLALSPEHERGPAA